MSVKSSLFLVKSLYVYIHALLALLLQRTLTEALDNMVIAMLKGCCER